MYRTLSECTVETPLLLLLSYNNFAVSYETT